MALSQKTLVMLLSMLMSEISEDAYASSWSSETEYAIWKVLQGSSTDERWNYSVSSEQAVGLKELSAELGGWLVTDPAEKDYVRLVPMIEWQQRFDAYVSKSHRR